MSVRFVFIGMLLLLASSCTKYKEEAVMAEANAQKFCQMDSVKFTDVQPIISNNCMPCHDNDQAQGGITLVTYDDISFQATDGALLSSINHDGTTVPMPSSAPKLA